MRKNILVLGKGFIGERLGRELGCRVSGAVINSFSDADRLLGRHRPEIVINCIGSSGRRNVDDCEEDKEATLLANSFIPLMLAEACLRRGIKLVHISTGCIFNFDYRKDKPIKEGERNYFLKLFYSRSKIYSEAALEALSAKAGILILRIRIPLLDESHPRNILDKLVKYEKIVDVPNSVTYLPDFIRALKHLIGVGAVGVYNVVNKGGLRYSELMKVYRKYLPGPDFKFVSVRKLPLTRTNLLLSVAKLERTGFKVRDIHSVLDECLKHYVDSLRNPVKHK